jgi:S-adenosylmethionine:tRNA ribosyltransferase-isomerase
MLKIEDIQQIKIEDFNYILPNEKIAKYPKQKRDSSKLLIYKNNKIQETVFSEIDKFIPQNSLLIYNNTKVIHARLHFRKTTGAKIEIFCLEPESPKDYNLIFQETNSCTWKCIVGNLKKWKQDKLQKNLNINGANINLTAEKIENKNGLFVKFSWNNPKISFGNILEKYGQIPIPPYMNREAEDIDKEKYQTVYSQYEGSVAAPTAGLHFTENVFLKLKQNNVKINAVTLHVGAGTFKPVKSETIGEHEMHFEHFTVNKNLLLDLKNFKGNIFPVGTTSVRTIESLYYIACKIQKNTNNPFTINQWDAYILPNKLSPGEAIDTIINFMENKHLDHIKAKTQIMINPAYKFKFVNGIITNFHQPKSTLLLLIAAVVGNNWKKIYNYALKNNFRFLSYGDSSLLFVNQK